MVYRHLAVSTACKHRRQLTAGTGMRLLANS